MISRRGQTEEALVTLSIPADPEEKVIERDGNPLPGTRMRVVDEAGAELAPGTKPQASGPFPVAPTAGGTMAQSGLRPALTGAP